MKLDTNNHVLFEVFLGESIMTIQEILAMQKGSIITTGISAGERVQVTCNKHVIATGEVLVYEKQLGVRLLFDEKNI